MTVIHGTYLPFEPEALRQHFAQVGSRSTEPDRHLRYYEDSAHKHQQWLTRAAEAAAEGRTLNPDAEDVQVEKDERFWVVTALLQLARSSAPAEAFAGLLARAFGPGVPPVAGALSWEQLLTGDLELFFEVNLPSPTSYQAHLSQRLDTSFLLPTQRTRAAGTRRLEGTTKADAVLVAPATGFAVVFEAKVLSDVSTTVRFDAIRNQLARTLDVSLERHERLSEPSLAARDPEKTCVVLLTPEVFRDDPTTRLYGWLHGAYRADPATLHQHLPHRTAAQCVGAAARLGWATWEDVNRVRPSSLPWLTRPHTSHHSPSERTTAEGPKASA